jgi:hypothetical protein
MNWSQEELEAKLAENPALRVVGDAIARELDNRITHPERYVREHKYHAQRTEYNGRWFDSKKEAQHADDNDTKIKAGIMNFYLTQVPFRLPGGIVHRVDFAEFQQVANTSLYEVHFVEVKGYRTRLGEVKRKMTEELYKIEIEVV